jgi:EmrB/QacA subfamily drug resistance transporter
MRAIKDRTEMVALRSGSGRWLLLVTVLGSGMAFLDGTIINVAIPAIGRDFHASTSSLQWILSGYLLTLASLILLGGSLGDRFGRRRVFVMGAVLFSAASLLCAIAPTVGTLIAARLFQGIGGALLTPASLAMIESSVRREDRPRAIGAWSGMTGVASALGPLLGGYLIGAVSWRAAFLINVPMGAFVILAAKQVPESRDTQAQGRLDVRGALLAAVALAGCTYALIEGAKASVPVASIVAGVIAAAAATGFLLAERRSISPMLPFQIFSKQFTVANLVTLVVYAALSGVSFLLVAFLQVSLGYTPLAAGAALLPVTLLMLCFSPAAGTLAQKIGPKLPLTIGTLVIAAGMLLMTQIGPGEGYLRGVLPAVMVLGLGLTLVVSPVTATVLAAVSDRHSGIASGVNNAVARVAGLLAVALLPLLAGLSGDRFYQPASMTQGFHVAMAVCAGLATVGALIAGVSVDNGILKGEKAADPDLASAPTLAGVTGPTPAAQRPTLPAETRLP